MIVTDADVQLVEKLFLLTNIALIVQGIILEIIRRKRNP